MDQKSELTQPRQLREDIDETREALAEKLETLEDQLRDTVQNVKTSIRQFSPKYQTKQHPLLMVGGALATGMLVGKMIQNRRVHAESLAYLGDIERPSIPRTSEYEDLVVEAPRMRDVASIPTPPVPQGPSLLERFTDQFGDEIQMVKGMVLGNLARAAGDWAKKQAPPDWSPSIDEVVDSAVRKLQG
jgi:ElaB/YqjD/DUF883 family membrane-anchored ribosome-binding protein